MTKWRRLLTAAALLSSLVTTAAGYAATTELISVDAAGVPVGAKEVALSDDGRFVLFSTNRPNIVTGVSSPYFLLYMYDRQTGINELVSKDVNGTPIPECYIDAFRRNMSADGRYVTFYTSYLTQDLASGNLLATASATANQRVYVKDRLTGEISCASLDSAGQMTTGRNGSISANGQFVAFLKRYAIPGPGETQIIWNEIYVTDLAAGTVTPLTGDFNPGAWGYKSSISPSLSNDGQYVVFKSAVQLTAEPLHRDGIFVYNTAAGIFERIDTNASGSVTDQYGTVTYDTSDYPTMSDDGRFVSYKTYKAGLDSSNNTVSTEHCFVADRTAGTIVKSDIAYFHPVANRTIGGIFPVINANGNYVHFKEYTGRKNSTTGYEIEDLFVFERTSGNIARVNLSSSGEGADGSFFDYSGISADGSLVVFNSVATNLVPGVTTPNAIYARNTAGQGYPLSFTINKAEFETTTGVLTIEAASTKGAFAGMEALNYGVMTWDSGSSLWKYSGSAGAQPASVVIGNLEGYKTVPVVAVTDTMPPVVVNSVPAANATNVTTSAPITIDFNEVIAKGATFASITLKKGSTVSKITTSISGGRLTIKPSANLSKNTVYTVTVPANAVKDAGGNELAAAYSFSFRTVAK